jgi:phosphoenolpyruvate carboxylase
MQKNLFNGNTIENSIVNLGFWPGGDRDGNPFVTPEITEKVAKRLRTSILKCYYFDIRALKRKLTFNQVDTIIANLEYKLYRSVFYSQGELFISLEELSNELNIVKQIIINEHQSLYLDEIDMLLQKINQFGFHFATLDIRQNSHVHKSVFEDITVFLKREKTASFPENFETLSEENKINVISTLHFDLSNHFFENETTRSTLDTIKLMREIQKQNGERGCNRYIISNNESALNVIETFAMFRLLDWENPTVDIVPLFESVDDLQNAHEIMVRLYKNVAYRNHIKHRKDKQTVMLGFSDGTKDGGYLMANWSIFKAKEAITEVSRKYGIKVIFFDGRGGPPARGGGKTHKFYASLGSTIENQEIQVTVQGQTISSNFGTVDSCRYNLENLLSAGVANAVYNKDENNLSDSDRSIINELATISYQKYLDFKSHPKFIPYLEQMSTLKYYSKTNIGSRPSKRNSSEQLNFADLRAIPFVGAWSQMKQNVPGFFGVGAALKHFETTNQWEKVQKLYDDSLFFRTLLENSMMSLAKSYFPLTAYMREDADFGEFWQIIFDEFSETKLLLLKIAGHKELMENYPDGKASIAMREQIVLPLLTIQQYASSKINEIIKHKKGDGKLLNAYEKLVTRSLFGNTNASRNSS